MEDSERAGERNPIHTGTVKGVHEERGGGAPKHETVSGKRRADGY
jgi:hypothetical protein